jgi:hypothetical protein
VLLEQHNLEKQMVEQLVLLVLELVLVFVLLPFMNFYELIDKLPQFLK